MRTTIFGIPTSLPADRATGLIAALTACWRAQFGSSPAELEDDLDRLHGWFNPRATGARLRKLIDQLPDDSAAIPAGADRLFLVIDSDRHVVTPEGRVILELMGRTPVNDDVCLLDPNEVDRAVDLLAETYRSWTSDNLRRVVDLLAGETETLRPAAAGLLLVLLVNRNTAPDRAIPRVLGDEVRAREIEDAITGPASAWGRTFTSRSGAVRPFRLYQGWEVGELRRRLGSQLHIGDDGIYVAGDPKAALARVESDLVRRPASFRAKVPGAFQALVSEYAQRRPVLRGLGVGHEVPSNTAAIEAQLVEAVSAVEPS